MSRVNSLIRLFVEAHAKMPPAASQQSGEWDAKAGRLLGPAVSKTPRCRKAMPPTARIARAGSGALTATELALRHSGCDLQSGDILLYSRLVVCEIGFLACDTCSSDKAIRPCRTVGHCLAISFCSRRLRPDEHGQKQRWKKEDGWSLVRHLGGEFRRSRHAAKV